MSARNTLEAKSSRRARKHLRKELPRYVDLVAWLKLKRRMTTGDALRLLQAGTVKTESHTVKTRYIRVELLPTLRIEFPKDTQDV